MNPAPPAAATGALSHPHAPPTPTGTRDRSPPAGGRSSASVDSSIADAGGLISNAHRIYHGPRTLVPYPVWTTTVWKWVRCRLWMGVPTVCL